MKVSFKTEELLSLSDAAKELHVTRMTLYRWIKKGKVETVTFGGYRAIHKSEVERLRK